MDEDLAYGLSAARQKLRLTGRREPRPMAALAAAAFFAICALTFAACAVLAPANETTTSARAAMR